MLTFLNDRHIGAIRSAGTTPQSQMALRQFAIDALRRDLPNEGDVLLGGDLFDTFSVPAYDVLRAYEVLADWLTHHQGATLYNMAGNHDLSKTSNVVSSFQLLGKLLLRAFPTRYVHIESPQEVPYGYAIPHLRNQEIFNMAVAAAPACRYLFLHCNFDNNFAAQSDHSLNFSLDHLRSSRAETIVFAHEHHLKQAYNVLIPGVQSCTSVADWLSPHDKHKVCISQQSCELIVTESRSDFYAEVPIGTAYAGSAKFLRVVGSVAAADVSRTISWVNRLRAQSDAFVITNAVETVNDQGVSAMIESSLEQMSGFDIMAALREFLTAEEIATLEPFYAEYSDAN